MKNWEKTFRWFYTSAKGTIRGGKMISMGKQYVPMENGRLHNTEFGNNIFL